MIMRRLVVVALLLSSGSAARGDGLLIPAEKKLPPLAMVSHRVNVTIDDQVAVTEIEQVFRNHTDRPLEATYVFPVPKGASVRKFSMWVGGTQMPGELLEADKARKIYTDIVRRTLDPGLLEYVGNDIFQVKVFPIPPRGDQKIKLSFSSVAPSDNGVIQYVYPLKSDSGTVRALEKFALTVRLKSQRAVQSIYSPTHNITTIRDHDGEATVTLEANEARTDRDFQLFYSAGGKDIGLTAVAHRPDPSAPGYFMILAAPRVDLSKDQQIPRDMFFVLDTSGSMRGKRIAQAKAALKFCLNNLAPHDRFNLLHFATAINTYKDHLLAATPANIEAAVRWVDALEATGGTNINDALLAALEMRGSDAGRPYTVAFFTDGQPTVGQTNPDMILKNIANKNTANTRIFTFGVGDDVNASLLDQLADRTRAVSTYCRESEDIEAKVSSLYAKISTPVLSNLKMRASDNVTLSEIYPPELPDLFHGTQLVIFGRNSGDGNATVTLTGSVGKEAREFTYSLTFPSKTSSTKGFVEDLWARRKVGYLLDQIRANGNKKELVDEVVLLAKRYGITTPYTSYLIVPDGPVIIGRPGEPRAPLPALRGAAGAQIKVKDFAQNIQSEQKLLDERRALQKEQIALDAKSTQSSSTIGGVAGGPGAGVTGGGGFGGGMGGKGAAQAAQIQLDTFDKARVALSLRDLQTVQTGNLGVEYSMQMNQLRNQSQLTTSASRNAFDRNCVEVGGVWIDDKYDRKMEIVSIKAMSDAYFRLLERQPRIQQVYSLGNHVVWVTPSGKALVIDTLDGLESIADAEIDRLFAK
jgi:Ca-activated chloride channel family protein